MSLHPPLAVEPLGDQALVAAWPPRIDEPTARSVAACARRVARLRLPGVRDVVSGANTVTVHVDATRADLERLRRLLEAAPTAAEIEGNARSPVVIPVRYGGDDGPDLDAVAREVGCTIDAVVEAHTAVTYRVLMMGFLPGFAYLGLVDPRIRVPRLETPRTRVPGGSVGLAGPQTGVYPRASPGGWRIIGRTALRLFDPDAEEPFLLSPGQAVRFDAARAR